MRQLTSIVARANEGAIGARNRLPWRLSSDMRFFRQMTLGNVVVMGRRTFDSLNGCLPDRRNVVVTHGYTLFDERQDCRVAYGIEEALITAEQMARKSDDVFVIGGASMYEQFAPFVDRYLITEIALTVTGADTFFNLPELEDSDRWVKKVIGGGRANPPRDEADYTIVEYVARDVGLAAERRREIVDSWRPRESRRGVQRTRWDASGDMLGLPL